MLSRWRWLLLTRDEKTTIVILAGVAIVFVVLLLWFPNFNRYGTNTFGPEWDCMKVPKSEPICVKRTVSEPKSSINQ